VENLGGVGFLLNFLVGEEELFPPGCSLLSILTPSRAAFALPSLHKSQPLCMRCTAEQMRSSSTGAPPNAVAGILFFWLSQPRRQLVTSTGGSQGQAGPRQPWGRGRLLLLPLYCVGNSADTWVSLSPILLCHRYGLLVQSPQQERAQCHYAYIRRVKLACRCWRLGLTSVL